MLAIADAGAVTCWAEKIDPDTKKKKKFKVRVGIRVIYNDGITVIHPKTGLPESGRGTQGFFSLIHGTVTWKPPQRCLTDQMKRPILNDKGEIDWLEADLGGKANSRGMTPEDFKKQGGFALRILRDLEATQNAADEAAEEYREAA